MQAVSENKEKEIIIKNNGMMPVLMRLGSENDIEPFSVYPLTLTNFIIDKKSKYKCKIRFEPKKAMTYEKEIIFEYDNNNSSCNDSSNKFIVKLKGIGKYPYLKVSNDYVEFKNAIINEEEEKIIYLENISDIGCTFNIKNEDDENFNISTTKTFIGKNEILPLIIKYKSNSYNHKIFTYFNINTLSLQNLRIIASGIVELPKLKITQLNNAFDINELNLKIQNTSEMSISFQLLTEKHHVFHFDKTQGIIEGNNNSVLINIKFKQSITTFFNYYKKLIILFQVIVNN